MHAKLELTYITIHGPVTFAHSMWAAPEGSYEVQQFIHVAQMRHIYILQPLSRLGWFTLLAQLLMENQRQVG